MLGREIDLGNIPEYILNQDILIPVAIALFIIWLIYRIRYRTRRMISKEVYKEIYKHFPTIRKEMDNFEYRIKYLNSRLADLENKINELARRSEK